MTGLISCSSAKQNVINDDDKILFIKAVSTFEMIDELNLDWNLKRLDTLIENDKIKYDILSNEKEEILEDIDR